MPYDYPNKRAVENWDWPAQAALWRERAMHEQRRAEYFKHRLTAADGSTEQPLPDSPVLLAHDDNAPRNTAHLTSTNQRKNPHAK